MFFSSDERKSISADKLDWGYLIDSDVNSKADYVLVITNNTKFKIADEEGFCKIMYRNKDKIFYKKNENSIKIYFRFSKSDPLVPNFVYEPDQYEGKESTFYVDESLLSELEKLRIKTE